MSSRPQRPARTVVYAKAPEKRGALSFSMADSSRLRINHSLLPLCCLPRKRAGEKIRKEAIFSQGVACDYENRSGNHGFLNTLLGLRPHSAWNHADSQYSNGHQRSPVQLLSATDRHRSRIAT